MRGANRAWGCVDNAELGHRRSAAGRGVSRKERAGLLCGRLTSEKKKAALRMHMNGERQLLSTQSWTAERTGRRRGDELGRIGNELGRS